MVEMLAPAQTRPAVLDRVNPVTKLLMVVILSVPLMFSVDWVSSLVAFGIELLLVPLAGISYGRVFKRMAPLFFLAPLSGITMLLYGEPSGTIYWHWGFATISEGSVSLALGIIARVFAMTLPVIVLFARVDSTEMADALAQVAHFPSRFVLATLAGTRTVGLFMNDWRQMELARRARGVGDSGRFKRFFSMAFVLLVFAMRRGSGLATAMESRGLGAPIKRTWARESRLHTIDLWAVLAAVLIVAVAIWVSHATGAWTPLFS